MAAEHPSAPSSLSVAAARQTILDRVAPVAGSESVPIRAALGRVLARDIVAPFDVPAHDNSAMDGYCVRAADLSATAETRLTVVGRALAGAPFSGLVGRGQAVRIMTGAMIPQGGDTVVVQEVVRVDGDAIVIPAGQQAGQNVRRRGEDLVAGRPALPAGKRCGPAELGLVASLGIGEVSVRRRLRVAYFSTGDEIASIGQARAAGEIYDSNRYTLHGVFERLGVEAIDMGVVRDEPASLEAALREAAAMADVIITSGGVSVGEADYVKELVGRLGAVDFWKIDIKPGRPFAFGQVGGTWFFGLPGNPVAVLVSFYQIALDPLLKLMGVDPLPQRPLFRARLASPIRKSGGRREFPRGRLYCEGGEWRVSLTAGQGSGILRSMSEANCFIVLPETTGNLAAGDAVEVQPFDGLI
jgi:molybdopterin molybdotransferase